MNGSPTKLVQSKVVSIKKFNLFLMSSWIEPEASAQSQIFREIHKQFQYIEKV